MATSVSFSKKRRQDAQSCLPTRPGSTKNRLVEPRGHSYFRYRCQCSSAVTSAGCTMRRCTQGGIGRVGTQGGIGRVGTQGGYPALQRPSPGYPALQRPSPGRALPPCTSPGRALPPCTSPGEHHFNVRHLASITSTSVTWPVHVLHARHLASTCAPCPSPARYINFNVRHLASTGTSTSVTRQIRP